MPFIYMRRHQKTVLWILVIVIVPAFCLFGVLMTQGNRPTGTRGHVMGQAVSEDEFRDAYVRWYRAMSLTGQRSNLSELEMWNNYVLVSVARKWGLQVSDAEVAEHVKKVFGGDVNFSIDRTGKILERAGLSLRDYEQTVREMLLLERVINCITNTVKVTDEEARHLYRFYNSTINVSVVRFDTKDFEDDVEKAETGRLRHFFFENADDYTIAAKYKFEYVAAKFKDTELTTKIAEEEIRKYYDDNKDRYELNEPAGEEDKEDAEKKGPSYKPLSEVKKDIESRLRTRKARQRAVELVSQLEERIDTLLEDTEPEDIDLAALADELGLTHGTTDLLTARELRRVEDIQARGDRIDYLCGVEPGYTSMAVQGYVSQFLVRVMQKQQRYIPEFTEVEDIVKTQYVRVQAAELALEAAENFAELAARTSFQKVVEKLKLKSETFGPVNRMKALGEIPGSTSGFINNLFATPTKKLSRPMLCGASAMIALITKRAEPDWKKFEKEHDSMMSRYYRAKANTVLTEWIASLDTAYFGRDEQ